jgi:hypothetical protein
LIKVQLDRDAGAVSGIDREPPGRPIDARITDFRDHQSDGPSDGVQRRQGSGEDAIPSLTELALLEEVEPGHGVAEIRLRTEGIFEPGKPPEVLRHASLLQPVPRHVHRACGVVECDHRQCVGSIRVVRVGDLVEVAVEFSESLLSRRYLFLGRGRLVAYSFAIP